MPAADEVVRDEPSGPLTYQVFTANDLAGPRSGPRSGDPLTAGKTSIGLRVCLMLVGLCVVFGTAAAVIAVSTEDAPKPSLLKMQGAQTPSAAPAPTPTPSVKTIGDPPTAESAAAVELPPSAPNPPSPASPPAKSTKSSAKASGEPAAKPTATVDAPPSLKGMAPPPNPYAGSGKK
jgi:hypothetical protein